MYITEIKDQAVELLAVFGAKAYEEIEFRIQCATTEAERLTLFAIQDALAEYHATDCYTLLTA